MMNIQEYINLKTEKPLDNIVSNGGYVGIFRTIACIGDSLSSGEFESKINGKTGYHDYYDYSWGQYIARDAGCTVYNFSCGGMNAKNYCEGFASRNNYWSSKYEAQAYIIALGVNDISDIIRGDTEFGDISDIDIDNPENNKETFVGYYSKIIQKYKKIQPKAKVFLMSVPRQDNATSQRNELYDRHRELLYSLADMFENCYVLDLRKYAPVYDNEFRSKFFLGSHMAPCGYRLTAIMVESYIDYIIRNNMEDFLQTGFVGTEFYNEEY